MAVTDLISKAALFNALCNANDKAEIFGIINGMPTVDAIEVVRGEIIGVHEGAGYHKYCSVCQAFLPTTLRSYANCCPYCGAIYDEEWLISERENIEFHLGGDGQDATD